MRKKLSIVVPCYNEEEVLPESIKRLKDVLNYLVKVGDVSEESFILLVNDGSRDNTWNIIRDKHGNDKSICGLNLTTNVGHQNALFAGMSVAHKYSDIIVTIDADLQDDVNTIITMVQKSKEGYEIIYGVRKKREKDTFFKRSTAQLFYKLMKLMGAKTIYNHADFRLMSKKVVKNLMSYQERNLFLRGIIPLLDMNATCVYYDREERFAGESKYPFFKMLNFAIDGITSFSVRPLRLIFLLGISFIFISILVLIYTLYSYFCLEVEPGWSSLVLSIWFCSGCILSSIGVIGEYIGKSYIESKHRPRYNIEELLIENKE